MFPTEEHIGYRWWESSDLHACFIFLINLFPVYTIEQLAKDPQGVGFLISHMWLNAWAVL
ncbi:uncharacterized protein N7500_001742 [Penicillium coprophilum]|uniref:uncharacterized protein n=1 Tax=Penicillium coprophilum TaxID=36646 RepID=UPI002398BF93|nr:uncharacterized protein N7500_001742 [Penicillium coprophilum]KAJ5173811.1 hypothetical protein N7500_001742 [Penicillium coprophilum]